MYTWLELKEILLFAVVTITYLQSLLQQLVHARHPGGNAEVDRPVADLYDQSAADVRVDLQHR
jgi:hypothetical protein